MRLLLVVALLLSTRVSALLPLKTPGTAKVVGSVAVLSAVGSWWERRDDLYTPAPGSLSDKTVLITGGTTGLGLESAKRLAYGGAQVIVTSRSIRKGEDAISQIADFLKKKGISNEKISFRVLDLDDLASVKAATEWNDLPELDVLLNNAGIMAPPDLKLTIDGVERQMQSNHLGHFVLTATLAKKLKKDARIINVSSTAHTIPGPKGLDFDYMWKGSTGYGAWKSYGQSKLANIHFTLELQRRARAAGLDWECATLHPGVVATDLGRYIIGEDNFMKQKSSDGKGPLEKFVQSAVNLFLKTPEQGATTQIWLASGEGHDIGGKYFVDCDAKPLAGYATDAMVSERLWNESEGLSGISFDLSAPLP